MQLVQLILPSLATIALGSAMLAPHREERPRRENTQPVSGPPNEGDPEPDAFAQLVADLQAPLVESADGSEGGEATAFRTSDDAAAPAPHEKRPAGAAPIENERVVPLTRRRLRRQVRAVVWPALLDSAKTACGAEERAFLLGSIDSLATGTVRERVLLEAIAQEEGEIRLAALRALARSPSPAAGDAFAEILVSGSDDERALAIEALSGLGRREDLAAAFADRVDAIAAKAVLAYVGTRRRADYVEIFETRLERSQRETILTLLAGALD